jgi:isopentenyl-diphosphate delta-isomerase
MEAMKKERLLLVNEKDVIIGTMSKHEAHMWKNDTSPLHRAFSVFLFNSKNEFLLQRRAMTKITFPGIYSNTVCSHPLDVPDEIEDKDAIGVRRAASRRLVSDIFENMVIRYIM